MDQWAENEVKLACKREAPDRKEGEWDYGCACYESALKAYNSLLEDGHSGFSWSLTRDILNRLMYGKPLTPIEEGDIWNEVGGVTHEPTIYQCRRMSSLFKRVYADGRVEYSDIDSYVCKNINTGFTFRGGPASRIINSMFPITLPYFPSTKPMTVYVEEFLFDEKNGDFDTVGILYAVKADGERVKINRYLAETPSGFQDIDRYDYDMRKNLRSEIITGEEK